MIELKNTDYIIAFDLEATCCTKTTPKEEWFPRNEMEIIEIGAVLLDTKNSFKEISSFESFIKPKLHPKLTNFCKELTTISQSDIDSAPPYPKALKSFMDWAFEYKNLMFVSWGNFDSNQFYRDSKLNNTTKIDLKNHRNAKYDYAKTTGLKKGIGIRKALNRENINFKGTPHRGIDDSRSFSQLLPLIYKI